MAQHCDDAFQRLQALQERKRQLEGEVQDLHKLIGIAEHSPQAVLGPEGRFREAADQFIARLDGPQLKAWAEHGMETKARADISSGGAQPVNFAQLLKRHDLRTVEDYAKLSKALLDTGSAISPDAFKFVNQTYGREEVMRLVQDAYGDIVGSEKLGQLLATDVAPFMGLVERMTRLRVAEAGFKKALTDDIGAMAAHRAGSSAPVPGELKAQFYQSLKASLVAERHLDLARSRTGQTLRSLREDLLPDLDALRRDLEQGDVFDPVSPEIESELGTKPGDTEQGSTFAAVVEALDDLDPQRGAEKLRAIQGVITELGTDPKARLKKTDFFNLQMLQGNLLAKDHQLTNFRTQFKTNLLSNAAMMVYGPYRQLWENYFLVTPAGTKFSRQAWQDAYQSAGAGVRMGIDVLRSSGKEVFGDAYFQGKAVFAGNKDVGVSGLRSNDQLVLRYQGLLDMPYRDKGFANPVNWAIARNKIHAAYRLFVAEKTGQPSLLEAGLRLLGAQDNVAGLYHHAFKVRNDLELRARRDGVQLGLDTPKSVQEWVDAEFDKAFYSIAPTENDVKAYRREKGLTSEVTDDDIKSEIITNRLGDTYGGPTFGTQESIDAEQYSREMRFQNEPGDSRPDSIRGQLGKSLYDGIQTMRGNWLGDFAVPYMQSLLMGTFTDMQHMGVTPAIDSLSMWMHPDGFTPAQKARVQAHWMVAGSFLGSFAILDMAPDMIIGNGPTEPSERQEWLIDLERRGLKPNSIAGVDLPGGIPILNTLMRWKDIKENIIKANVSNYDQHELLWGVTSVLTGQLMTQTSLGLVQELYKVFTNKNPQSAMQALLRTAGYVASSQMPTIGAWRDVGYASATSWNSYYHDRAPTGAQRQVEGDDWMGRMEQFIKDAAAGTLPVLQPVIGGVKREQDWLGSPINLPWGMRYVEALKQRFFPQLWPQGMDGGLNKVYAELDKQNLLNPPQPLMTGELDGVGMSAELQDEYQKAYSHTKGDSVVGRFGIAGANPTLSVSLPYRIDLPTGATYERSTKLVSISVAPFIESHIKGKTVAEAMLSVINSPLYQALERLPGTSASYAVRDQLPGQRRGKPGQILLQSVKRYYQMAAHDALVRSGSEDAQAWKESRAAVFQQRQRADNDKLRDLVEALGPSQ